MFPLVCYYFGKSCSRITDWNVELSNCIFIDIIACLDFLLTGYMF